MTRGDAPDVLSAEPAVADAAAVAAAATVADVVSAEWGRRTEAEYISAAIAQQVTLWLIQLGAPPDLIRDGLRIVADELAHSELSAAVAAAAAGGGGTPVIDPAALHLPDAAGPFASLVFATLRFFCVGETIAVPLFRMLRTPCSVPVARHALNRVLRDETRHRQFGWDVLDWLLLTDPSATRQRLADELPAAVEEVRTGYGAGAAPDVWPPELAAWGLASASTYATTVTAAITTDLTPRLAARGIVLP